MIFLSFAPLIPPSTPPSSWPALLDVCSALQVTWRIDWRRLLGGGEADLGALFALDFESTFECHC